jgi:cation diffusion facilitator family transporter
MQKNDLTNTRNVIRTVSFISITANLILCTLKIGAGLLGKSMAVVADGIDSSTDVLISILTLFTAGIMTKPADDEHPYGHARAEAVTTKVLSFIIFFAGTQIIWTTIEKLISPQTPVLPEPWLLLVAGISICAKALLAFYKLAAGRKINSSMLLADAKNMVNDVLLSATVLIGLFFTFILKIAMIDSIVTLLVGIWIMKQGISIFLETSKELMDGLDDQGLYEKVFQAVAKIPLAGNPHRVRIRRAGSQLIIDLDIEVDGKLTVYAAHDIAIAVESSIKNSIENVYDIMVHLEPAGNIENGEQFGHAQKSGSG